jgi:hypothetical protein
MCLRTHIKLVPTCKVPSLKYSTSEPLATGRRPVIIVVSPWHWIPPPTQSTPSARQDHGRRDNTATVVTSLLLLSPLLPLPLRLPSPLPSPPMFVSIFAAVVVLLAPAAIAVAIAAVAIHVVASPLSLLPSLSSLLPPPPLPPRVCQKIRGVNGGWCHKALSIRREKTSDFSDFSDI